MVLNRESNGNGEMEKAPTDFIIKWHSTEFHNTLEQTMKTNYRIGLIGNGC